MKGFGWKLIAGSIILWRISLMTWYIRIKLTLRMSKLNLVCLGYYVMWRDKACICFKNHGATIEFQVWCSNKTNTILLRFDYTYSEIYNWKKKAVEKRYSETYIPNQYRMSNCCLCKITKIFLINFSNTSSFLKKIKMGWNEVLIQIQSLLLFHCIISAVIPFLQQKIQWVFGILY